MERLKSVIKKRGGTIIFYRYYLKVCQGKQGWTADVTPDPSIEQNWGGAGSPQAVAFGDLAYPLGVATRIVREIRKHISPDKKPELKELERVSRRAARRTGDFAAPRWFWLETGGEEETGLTEEERARFSGKLLSGFELAAAFRELGDDSPVSIERKLHGEVLRGLAERMPGVERDALGRVFCRRCGETFALALTECVYCGSRCWVCQSCASLGSVRECIPLYRFFSAPVSLKARVLPPLRISALTPVQEEAAEKVRAFCRQDKRREFLIWAVCGAGKTEVTFPAIHEALARGRRVLYAIPRRDVVREIGGRMEGAFPGLPIAVLFGGDGRKDEPDADLTVATTHQVLRFVDRFDLAVLDEADAYPYDGSRMLRFGLQRALKEGGHLIYLTATPTRDLRERAAKGDLEHVLIPVRHHGYPMPEPVLVVERLSSFTRGDCRVPRTLLEFFAGSRNKDGPMLIFLPTIEQVENFGAFLQDKTAQNIGLKVQWIHAELPQRDAAIKEFRTGACSVLVTTTVLERGLNFPGVDIVVLHADHEKIFDVETLVQIAGRAGRFPSQPYGRVLFIGRRISRTMQEAGDWIRSMNQEARRRGLLVDLGEEPS